MSAPETRYALSGDMHIAYQVVGDGHFDIVFVHGWISHIEHLWEEPSIARFFRRLASFSRLILLDKRGTGLSDPVALNKLPTLEERIDDVRAVMDAAGSKRAVLIGTSEAGALNLLFAATHPNMTSAVILLNSYARLAWAEDYSFGINEEQAAHLLDAVAREWGKGVAFEALVASQTNNQLMRDWWQRYQRLAASPGAAVSLLRMAFETDARGVLASINVPALILHRIGDPFTGPEHGRYLAQNIPGAKYVELAGSDHLFFSEDADQLIAEIQEFLTGVREPEEPERVLATILFIDIVGSTQHATAQGDQRWREIIERYYNSVHRELERFRGKQISTSGDGILAMFDGPARAIRCASAATEAVRRLGLEIRAGLHTGECDVVGNAISGIAVHMAARVADKAAANEVLVSSTVKDLVAGSTIRFEENGRHSLKGFEGEWHLFSVQTH